MKIIDAHPLVPHSCTREIWADPRSKELGTGSIVQCSCGKRLQLKSDYREKYWEGVAFRD